MELLLSLFRMSSEIIIVQIFYWQIINKKNTQWSVKYNILFEDNGRFSIFNPFSNPPWKLHRHDKHRNYNIAILMDVKDGHTSRD